MAYVIAFDHLYPNCELAAIMDNVPSMLIPAKMVEYDAKIDLFLYMLS